MSAPAVSVVVETVTAREDHAPGGLADRLAPTLAALAAQEGTRDPLDVIVVLDPEVGRGDAEAVARRFPAARTVHASRAHYFAAKNAGVREATGQLVALIDGDCVPAPDWLLRLEERLTPDVGVVAGRTRYAGRSLLARTFSVPAFGTVGEGDDGASGLLVNNLLARRDLLAAHPFDERLPRNGGCYLLFHRLRADGVRIAYAPAANVAHGLDVAGLGFVRKHLERGRDGVVAYRCDDAGVLRGTRWFRRLGALALIGATVLRIGQDVSRLVRRRADLGVQPAAMPWFMGVVTVTRTLELLGALAALRGTPRAT